MKGLEALKELKQYNNLGKVGKKRRYQIIEKELKVLEFLIDYGKIRIVDNMLYFGGCYFDLRKGEDISLLKEVLKNE